MKNRKKNAHLTIGQKIKEKDLGFGENKGMVERVRLILREKKSKEAMKGGKCV